MSLQSVSGLSFEFGGLRSVEIEVSDAPLTSDAGLLPVRQFDECLGFTRRFADALVDERDSDGVRHSWLSMVRQRVYGMLAGYEDQNDHDTLRHDPVFQLICDRVPDDGTGPARATLASQPTLSRFENAIRISDLWRLRDVLVDQFLQSFDSPPARVTLDLDAFDDPCHGQQQMVMFHGYYEQYQYLPIAITCAENDAVVLVGLRFGTCAAFLGADDDLRYLARRLRAVWPDVEIIVRGGPVRRVPRLRRAADVRRVPRTPSDVHVPGTRWRVRHERRVEAGIAGVAGRGGRALRTDRTASTVVPVADVPGRDVGRTAAGGHQVRGSRARHQPSRRGHQSSRCQGAVATRLRRVHRAR